LAKARARRRLSGIRVAAIGMPLIPMEPWARIVVQRCVTRCSRAWRSRISPVSKCRSLLFLRPCHSSSIDR
jgi:hypothetical protein